MSESHTTAGVSHARVTTYVQYRGRHLATSTWLLACTECTVSDVIGPCWLHLNRPISSSLQSIYLLTTSLAQFRVLGCEWNVTWEFWSRSCLVGGLWPWLFITPPAKINRQVRRYAKRKPALFTHDVFPFIFATITHRYLHWKVRDPL